MKRILLFSFALALWMGAHAQFSLGVSVGYDWNKLSIGDTYKPFYQDEGMPGLTVGIPLRYDFQDWFAIQSELTYIQKNHKSKRTFEHEGIYNNSFNSYLQVPLMAHFSFGGERLKGFVNLGGYGGYWISGKVKGDVPYIASVEEDYYSYNEKYAFDSRRDRRLELGLVAGGGAQYHLDSQYTLYVEARYYYSLSDIQKDYMEKRPIKYNNTLTVNVGCLFSLNDLFNGR